MRRLLRFLFIFLLLPPLPLSAQWLKEPLQWLPADSVRLWNYDGQDVCQAALRRVPPQLLQRLSESVNQNLTLGKDVRKQREAILKAWKTLTPHLNVVGGGDDEMKDAQTVPAAYALSTALPLFQLTADATYFDYIERAFYNALMRTLYLPATAQNASETLLAALLITRLPSYLYATDKQGYTLYLNLFTNATARIPLQGQSVSLDQITDMPDRGEVKFRLTQLARPLRLRILLRLPDWATGRRTAGMPFGYIKAPAERVEVRVNGHEVETTDGEVGGYLTIDRTWQNGDEIFVRFPLETLFLRPFNPSNNATWRGKVALQRGPLVYQFATPVDSCYFSTNAPNIAVDSLSAKGHLTLRGTVYRYANAPQDAAAPAHTFCAVPYLEAEAGILWCEEPK